MKIFPINISMLPGEKFPPHIFEPRYKKLIEDCKVHGETFGVCLSYSGKISRFGTEVGLHKVSQSYFDGSSDIIVKGIRSFEILNYIPDLSQESCDQASTKNIELHSLRPESTVLIDLYEEFSSSFRETDQLSLNFNLLEIARNSKLSFRQKDQFIRQSSNQKREELLIKHLKYLLLISHQEESREFNLLMN